jgi:hypothetical protein
LIHCDEIKSNNLKNTNYTLNEFVFQIDQKSFATKSNLSKLQIQFGWKWFKKSQQFFKSTKFCIDDSKYQNLIINNWESIALFQEMLFEPTPKVGAAEKESKGTGMRSIWWN